MNSGPERCRQNCCAEVRNQSVKHLVITVCAFSTVIVIIISVIIVVDIIQHCT